MAWPADVADGNVITAAHINSITHSVYQWQGNVDANQFALNNVKAISMISGVATGDALQLYQTAGGGVLFAGFQDTRNAGKIGAYNAGFRPVEIVGADAAAVLIMNSAQDGFVTIGYEASTGRGKIGAYNPAAGGWRTLVLNEAGPCMMFLGGTLKTLSVDGSGFVKAT